MSYLCNKCNYYRKTLGCKLNIALQENSKYCHSFDVILGESKPKNINDPKDTQIGGTHYKIAIEPIDYIMKNKLGFCEGNVIKYVTRHKSKNGVEDLKKAKHYIDFLISEYENEN